MKDPAPPATPPLAAPPPRHTWRGRLRRRLGLLLFIAIACGVAFLCHRYHAGLVLQGIFLSIPWKSIWNSPPITHFLASIRYLSILAISLIGTGFFFLLAILFFLKAFKKPLDGFILTILLFVTGFIFYGCPQMVKPPHLVQNGKSHLIAVGILRFDNALSGFFPTRAAYSDIAPDPSTSPAPSSHEEPSLSPIPPPSDNSDAEQAVPSPPSDASELAFEAAPAPQPPSDSDPTTIHPPPPSAQKDNATSQPSPALVAFFYGFHLLLYAYSIALASTFFSRRLANAILMLGVAAIDAIFRPKRPIRIFWGDGKEAFTAAMESLSDPTQDSPGRPHTVFIIPSRIPFALRHKPDPVTDYLNADGRLRWTYVSPRSSIHPMPWFLARASEHFFLGEDGRKNVLHANQLLMFLSEHLSASSCMTPVLHVRIDADSEDDPLFAWADDWNKKSVEASKDPKAARRWAPSIRIVREPTLVACNLLWNHPMHDIPGVSRAPDGTPSGVINLLIIGHGAHGKVLLRDLIQDAQFPNVSLRATIVDRDPAAFGFLETLAQEALEEYHIETKILDALSPGLLSLLPDETTILAPAPGNLSPDSPPPLWNRIILALENDMDNLRLALRIEKYYRLHGLFERLHTSAQDVIFARVRGIRNNEYLKALGPDTLRVSTFGNLHDIYRADAFPDAPTENAAKFLNWTYCLEHEDEKRTLPPAAPLPQEAESAWLNTSTFDRESSRAAVFGFRNLLWLLGFSNPGRDSHDLSGTDLVRQAIARLSPSDLDLLAETEHLRWNAFHRLRGIGSWPRNRYLPILDLPDQNDTVARTESGIRPNQRITLNRHAAIAPYAELPLIEVDFDDANKRAFPGKARPIAIDSVDKTLIKKMPTILAQTRWTISRPSL